MSEGKTRELYVEMPENSELRADALKEVTISHSNKYLYSFYNLCFTPT